MSSLRIVAIVEGHGEVEAVPLLIRRIFAEVSPELSVDVPKPIRVGRQKVMKEGELERAVDLAARQVGAGPGAILVLLDADEDCPKELADEIRRRAHASRRDRKVLAVVAKREFEAWILAAAESVAGHRELAEGLEAPADPESVGDAKGWLSRSMPPGRSYRETIDQAKLIARIDLGTVRVRSPSFDKLWRDIASLIG